jgi:hypothetical protein
MNKQPKKARKQENDPVNVQEPIVEKPFFFEEEAQLACQEQQIFIEPQAECVEEVPELPKSSVEPKKKRKKRKAK